MTTRYSEKRLAEDFTIYVLFSDHLEAARGEIKSALQEDFPGLDWTYTDLSPAPLNTRDVSMGVWAHQGSNASVKFIGMPGRCEVNWPDAIAKSRQIFPDAEAAVARHTDHIGISVSARDQTVEARFEAARRLTCIGAVLAELPITLGVFFPNADLIVSPERWCEAAQSAMAVKVPVFEWIALVPIQVTEEYWTVSTIGLAAFNGHEIVVPLIRDVKLAAHWATATAAMLLESDHVFADGDTAGVEGEGKPVRIRHVKEGMLGAQTDQWHLIHETSAIDEKSVYGKPSGRPMPAGSSNEVRGNWSSLKNRLYGMVAGR